MRNAMTLRSKVVFAMLVVGIAVTAGAGCRAGGDKETRKAALTAPETDRKDVNKPPPTGQEAPRATVGQKSGQDVCGRVSPSWAARPKSLKEARDQADLVVQAEIESVQAGEDIVLKSSQDQSVVNRIPTQKVTLKVLKKEKGQVAEGDTLILSKLGSTQECYEVEEDPPYKKGEKHLLFLQRGPEGTVQTIAPEGRYKIKADESLEAVVDPDGHEAVKDALGKKVKDVESLISEP